VPRHDAVRAATRDASPPGRSRGHGPSEQSPRRAWPERVVPTAGVRRATGPAAEADGSPSALVRGCGLILRLEAVRGASQEERGAGNGGTGTAFRATVGR
jgi:hypothetical protein